MNGCPSSLKASYVFMQQHLKKNKKKIILPCFIIRVLTRNILQSFKGNFSDVFTPNSLPGFCVNSSFHKAILSQAGTKLNAICKISFLCWGRNAFFSPVTFSSKRYQDSAAVLQPPAHAKEPSFTREQKKLGGIVTAPWCSFPSSSLLILAIIFFGSVVRYLCSTGLKKMWTQR